MKEVKDPHHDSICKWRWDGRFLWHGVNDQSTWTKVKRVSFTPARILAIASIIKDSEDQ